MYVLIYIYVCIIYIYIYILYIFIYYVYTLIIIYINYTLFAAFKLTFCKFRAVLGKPSMFVTLKGSDNVQKCRSGLR